MSASFKHSEFSFSEETCEELTKPINEIVKISFRNGEAYSATKKLDDAGVNRILKGVAFTILMVIRGLADTLKLDKEQTRELMDQFLSNSSQLLSAFIDISDIKESGPKKTEH